MRGFYTGNTVFVTVLFLKESRKANIINYIMADIINSFYFLQGIISA
jgi:hypothetical protein